MKDYLNILIFSFCLLLSNTVSTLGASAEKSVIRVNTTMQAFNLIQPWEKGAATSRLGLGAVLPDNKVLVTAQMVTDATYIELEKPDSSEKTPAKVITVDYEANLAVLKPTKNNAFLADREPFQIDEKISPSDQLEAWQFESNGTPVTTKITVSKAEVRQSFLDTSKFLQIQANGPVQYRAGSFTLPVAKDNKLAGLLVSYSSKDQISSILPASIIKHFLSDIEDGDYKGFPNLGIMYSQTLDEQFRDYLKLPKNEGGVFVSKVVEGASAEGNLKVGDVILEINKNKIDSRGNYNDAVWGKLSFSHLVRGVSFTGDSIQMLIIREGKEMDLNFKLIRRPTADYLIDPYMFDRGPKFSIIGGLVFQELSVPFLKLFGNDWRNRAPIKLLMAHANPEMYEKKGNKKLVIMTRTIPTPATLGYERLSTLIVTKINGIPIRDIQDVNNASKKPIDGQHRIEFESYPKLIFVDAALSSRVNTALENRIGMTQRLD